ncbi:glycoside alpha-1,2-mannosyltransferase homolog [Seminavis robusta]|uniref:Glycoside alpha-1,2-mannosyltransferase homolog n=1 Tax=Seminavis robusta TaxID=568900 RepID=A0A9N8EBG1_9STRA|nr:glycoside alpha-1,2-mannosyltransferase homolog [Seminavis robusta]|eukprot:Sro901_g218060.1 glycoside alpha-1,2-mannosyltransferase homolog (670) ;mRNA; f:31695-33927
MAARWRYNARPSAQATNSPLSTSSHQSSEATLKERNWWKLAVVALVLGSWFLFPTVPASDSSDAVDAAVQEFYVPSTVSIREGVRQGVIVKRTRGDSVCDSSPRFERNAWVLLAQKKSSTSGRDSLGLLVKTLDLFRQNYLAISNHRANVDIFLFHTGDFDEADLEYIENRLVLNEKEGKGILRLVDLNNTVYWSLPDLLQHDNPDSWKGSEIYPVGYRHMCRWFGMQLWHFFQDLNQQQPPCNYRYIARLDEDSFILSPIQYDLFDLMQSQQYIYAYRMCAFELAETLPKLWFKKWRKSLGNHSQRYIDPNLCGFYNNFFIADLQFFLSPNVTKFLHDIDRRGFFYRKRFGDLLVHSLAVYAFGPPDRIHRFLDFTYQHTTIDYFKDREKECISWGSLQAGYNDPSGQEIVERYYHTHVVAKDCPTANLTSISQEDLSPTYSHLPNDKKVALMTFHAGKVELPGQVNRKASYQRRRVRQLHKRKEIKYFLMHLQKIKVEDRAAQIKASNLLPALFPAFAGSEPEMLREFNSLVDTLKLTMGSKREIERQIQVLVLLVQSFQYRCYYTELDLFLQFLRSSEQDGTLEQLLHALADDKKYSQSVKSLLDGLRSEGDGIGWNPAPTDSKGRDGLRQLMNALRTKGAYKSGIFEPEASSASSEELEEMATFY